MATNLDSGFYNLAPTYPSRFNAALSFVTPFTHRTNISYAELLMELYKWLRDQHLPELDKILDDWKNQYQDDLNALKQDINSAKNSWQELFEQFMSDIVAQLEILNDQAVSNLLENKLSKTRETADKLFKHVVSITEHGGKPIPGFDNKAALQSAIDEASTYGGVVVIPFGEYGFNSGARMRDNVTVDLMGSTLYMNDSNTQNSVFKYTSLGKQGYGSSAVNTVIKNGVIRGNFANGSFVGMSVHHAKNAVFENLTFNQSIANGHSIDIMGSDGVVIRGCRFQGRIPVDGRNYVEAVQVDHSTRGGAGSSLDEDLSSYDGLPTINVLMEDCHSEPLIINNTYYPAPRLIGSHSRVADIRHKNITVRSCTITDSGNTETDGRYLGWIHFTHTDGLLIDDVEMINTRAETCVGIGMWGVDTTYPLSSVQQPSPALDTAAGSISSRNVTIRNIRFRGFNGTVVNPLIRLHGSNSDSYIENVLVDNIQVDNNTGVNNGIYVVSSAYAKNISVTNINVEKVSRIFNISESINVSFSNLTNSNWLSVGLYASKCKNIQGDKLTTRGLNSAYFTGCDNIGLENITHNMNGDTAVEYASVLSVNGGSNLNISNVNINGVSGLQEFGFRIYGDATDGNVSNVIVKGISIGYNDVNSTNVFIKNVQSTTIQRANPWVDLTLASGIVPQPNLHPKFRLLERNRVVYEGGVTGASVTTSDTLIGTVPAKYRPSRTQYIVFATHTASLFGRGRIEPSGAFYVQKSGEPAYLLATAEWSTD